MHCTPDPGIISHTEGAPAANKCFVPEPTVKYSAGTHYNRLIERHCASLDLEAAFKQINISRNIVKQVCKECKAEFCRCPAFTPGMPFSSVSSTPTSISDKPIPKLVAANHCNNCICHRKLLQMKKRTMKLKRWVHQVNITG